MAGNGDGDWPLWFRLLVGQPFSHYSLADSCCGLFRKDFWPFGFCYKLCFGSSFSEFRIDPNHKRSYLVGSVFSHFKRSSSKYGMAISINPRLGISLLLMFLFYLIAGLNHFRDPEFYIPLIPGYLPFPATINLVSGSLEVLLAFGLLQQKTKSISGKIIIIMLVLFIPSHIHFIAVGACIEGGLCVAPWVAWLRLIVIHPLLIYWAWRSTQ